MKKYGHQIESHITALIRKNLGCLAPTTRDFDFVNVCSTDDCSTTSLYPCYCETIITMVMSLYRCSLPKLNQTITLPSFSVLRAKAEFAYLRRHFGWTISVGKQTTSSRLFRLEDQLSCHVYRAAIEVNETLSLFSQQ